MSDSLKVQCPHCGGSLKLKDRSAEGKRVRCPKCDEAFKVELPDDDLDIVDDDFGEDFGGDDELADEEEAPCRSKGTSARKPIKKKRRSGSGATPWLLIACGLGLVVVLGGVGVLVAVVAAGGGEANKIDLAYLPADSNMVMQLKVSELYGSPLLADAMNQPQAQQMLGQLTQQFGIGVREITSVTMGVVVDESAQSVKFPNAGMFGMRSPQGATPPRTVTVIRSTLPMKQQEIAVTLLKGQAVTQNGATYYQGLKGPMGNPLDGMTMWFPESTVMVVGSSADVVGMAGTPNLRQARRREFDFINPNMTLLMAFAPKLATNPSATLSSPAGLPKLQDLERATNKTFRGGMFGFRISDRVDLEIIMQCADSSGAGEIKSMTDGLVADLKTQFERQKGMLSMMKMDDAVALGDQILSSLKVGQSGAVVTAMGTIPNEVKAVAERLSKQMPGMMGMPGLGGPPRRFQPPSTAGQLPPGFYPSQTPGVEGVPPGILPPGTAPPQSLPPGEFQPPGAPAATPPQ